MKTLVLFFAPFFFGLLAYIVPKPETNTFRLLLVFAGSYLFAITFIHMLPELTDDYAILKWAGLLMLLGFSSQYLLERTVFSGAVHSNTYSQNYVYSFSTAIPLFLILCTHAFLEGGMVAQSPSKNLDSNNASILLGIILHRMPIAFAMMTLLLAHVISNKQAIFYLVLFSLAAPAGLWASEYINETQVISNTGILFLYALMSGGFLYIVIIFIIEKENTISRTRKIMIATLGILLAGIIEHVI